jgi:hypothetical protein
VTAAVGEMYGYAGIPSLDPAPRGQGPHRLRALVAESDGETDETFGYLESGFLAFHLSVYAFERFRAFLQRHAGHRILEWHEESDHEWLAPEFGGDHDSFTLEEYEPPRAGSGFVRARLVVECGRCSSKFETSSPAWVRPLDAHRPSATEIQLFCEVARATEMNFHEVEPFDLFYPDLAEWLHPHMAHEVIVRLVSEPGSDT